MSESASTLVLNYFMCLSSHIEDSGALHFLIQTQYEAHCVQICEEVLEKRGLQCVMVITYLRSRASES